MKQSGIFVDSDLSNPLNKLFGDNIFKGCRNSTTSLLLHYFIRVRENYLMVRKRQLIEQVVILAGFVFSQIVCMSMSAVDIDLMACI